MKSRWLMFVIILVCTLASVIYAQELDEALVGNWVVVSGEINGEVIPIETLQSPGKEVAIYMNFHADGTAEYKLLSTPYTGTWFVQDGLLHIDDGIDPYVCNFCLKNSILSIEFDSDGQVLTINLQRESDTPDKGGTGGI